MTAHEIDQYGLDPHKITLRKLKELYRFIQKCQRDGGGYNEFLLFLEEAIKSHPDAKPVQQEA